MIQVKPDYRYVLCLLENMGMSWHIKLAEYLTETHTHAALLLCNSGIEKYTKWVLFIKSSSMYEDCWVLIQMTVTFVLKGQVDKKLTLIHRTGEQPSPEPWWVCGFAQWTYHWLRDWGKNIRYSVQIMAMRAISPFYGLHWNTNLLIIFTQKLINKFCRNQNSSS